MRICWYFWTFPKHSPSKHFTVGLCEKAVGGSEAFRIMQAIVEGLHLLPVRVLKQKNMSAQTNNWLLLCGAEHRSQCAGPAQKPLCRQEETVWTPTEGWTKRMDDVDNTVHVRPLTYWALNRLIKYENVDLIA